MFEAKVIAHSIHGDKDIITFQLCYPRFVHGEFLTHRMLSRNSMSSRAIPVAKMIEDIQRDPAMPVFWGSNKPGMQAGDELAGDELAGVKDEWLYAMSRAINSARVMMDRGLHKQLANRILEPFQWMRTIVTATEWDNFYELRCHPDAQPEFQHLARMMRAAHDASEPEYLKVGDWHLPYITSEEKELPVGQLRKMSTARCARVSYLTHDGQHPSVEKDLALFDRLVGGKPWHASPLEHQATPYGVGSGNFKGWMQFRALIEREMVGAA